MEAQIRKIGRRLQRHFPRHSRAARIQPLIGPMAMNTKGILGPLARWHNWLIFAYIVPPLRQRLSRYAKGRLLDIGCGEQPYRGLAQPFVSEYLGVDLSHCIHGQHNVDIKGSAYETTVASASFDTVLCTDVLEHLEEPARAIAEAFRVLKPGGYAIYSMPLFWHLHEEPRDFFRYTKYGLDYLFAKAGFEVVEIVSLTGFTVTFAQELVYFLLRLRRGGIFNPLWWIIPPLGVGIQAVAYLIGKAEKCSAFCAEYIVVARKPTG